MAGTKRQEYQEKSENAMFPNNIRMDLMIEEDQLDSLGNENFEKMLEAMKNLSPIDGKVSVDFSESLSEIPETEIMDIDEIKEKFGLMVEEIAQDVNEALNLASNHASSNLGDKSWRPLRSLDRAATCPNCERKFSMNMNSNTQNLMLNVREKFKQMCKKLPITWQQENNNSRLFSWSENEIRVKKNGEDATSKLAKINWDYFRSALSNAPFEFEQATGPVRRDEMKRLYQTNTDWGRVAAGLIMCNRKPLTCPYLDCREHLYKRSLGTDTPFYKISYEATKIILQETIGSPSTRAPLSLKGYTNGSEITLAMGRIGEDSNIKTRKRNSRLIAEAVLTSTSILESIEIKTKGDITIDGQSVKSVTIKHEDSEESTKTYTTPSHLVVSRLAKVLEKIRPIEAFIFGGKDLDTYQSWSSRAAANILYAIHRSGIMFHVEKTRDYKYGKSNPKHSTNLIRLNDKIKSRVMTGFISVMADGETKYNSLEKMLSSDTTPPMVCEPEPWVIQSGEFKHNSSSEKISGGFKTVAAQKKYPLISRHGQYSHYDVERFIPSPSAINAINHLQNTEWAVDEEMMGYAFEAISKHVSDNILDKLRIRETEGKHFIDLEDGIPDLTFTQVNGWLNTRAFAERLKKNFPDMSFWHPWHFDWRGRVMPISTLLSPQNDDFSRGVITFANAQAIDETGIKWVRRVTASMYRDRPIPDTMSSDDKIHLEQLMTKLNCRSHESFDKVSSDPIFQKMIKIVVQNPIDNYESWAKGDVFKSKAEGLQRLAVSRLFVKVIEGGVGTLTKLPLNLDASSSIYQHASALMRDRDMASKVNVLSNGTNKPSDVYVEVVNHLKEQWQGNPFHELELPYTKTNKNGNPTNDVVIKEGLSDEIGLALKKKVLTRGMAKTPVMTIGYGAAKPNMTRSLLTDNGDETGATGRRFAVLILKDKKDLPEEIEDVDKYSKDDWRMLETAHVSSTLGKIFSEIHSELDKQIPDALHYPIARKIIHGYSSSIDAVLPGQQKMTKILKALCEEQLSNHYNSCSTCQQNFKNYSTDEDNHPKNVKKCICVVNENGEKTFCKTCEKRMKKSFFRTLEFLNCCGELSWVVNDGSKIVNIYLKDTKMKSVEAWEGVDRTSHTIRMQARKELRLPEDELNKLIPLSTMLQIDFESICDLLDEKTFNKLRNYESEKLNNLQRVLNQHSINLDSIDMANLVVDWPSLARELKIGNSLDDIIAFYSSDSDNYILKTVVNAVMAYIGTFNTTFSRQILSNERDLDKKKTGIAPNFVHSMDACHMRMVVNQLAINRVNDIWSVHDAFGCHPNHIDDLRFIVNVKFKETHRADEFNRGTMSKLHHDITGQDMELGDMDLDDIVKKKDGDLEVRYLIS